MLLHIILLHIRAHNKKIHSLRRHCFLIMGKGLALSILFDRSRGDLAFIRNCQARRSDEFKELPSCLPARGIGNRIERVDL